MTTLTDETPVSNTTRRRVEQHERAKQAITTITALSERFPACFAVLEARRRPLKIGIHEDILAAITITPEELGRALARYVSSDGYNRAYEAIRLIGGLRVGGIVDGVVSSALRCSSCGVVMTRTFRKFKKGKIPFQEATRCIFCGSSHLTAEHVFSRWTHKFLPRRSMKKYHVRRAETFIEKSEHFLVKRSGDIRDWKISCVCENKCNNGWMRTHIEDLARPIMTSLIKGDHLRLSPDPQKYIAAWATLKAMVAEYDAQGWVTTHHTHRKYLMRTFTPPPQGWVVWIGPYLRNRWKPHWGSMPFLFLSDKQDRRRGSKVTATYYNSHISTQVVGQLFIQVIRSPARDFIERWRFTLPDKGSFFRIWPPSIPARRM